MYNSLEGLSIAMQIRVLKWRFRWLPLCAAVTAAAALPVRLNADSFGTDLPTVDRIEILGNRHFDDGTLKKRMRTKESRFYHILRKPRFRRDFLRRDVESIQSFYHRNGFFDAHVSIDSVERDEKSNTVRIRLMVQEGLQTVVQNLLFSEQDLIPEKDMRKGLRLIEEAPYTPNLLEVDRYTLLNKFFERGYLQASITCSVDIDSTAVVLNWRVMPGEPVRIDTVLLEGNAKVKDRLIRRELRFEKGEYFRLKKVIESKQNLYDTGYFMSVEIEPKALEVRESTVDLLLLVRERKMGYIETGLGVGNVQGNRVFAEWGQRNLLGLGYVLHLKTAYAFKLFPDNEYALKKIDLRSKFIRHDGEIRFPHIFSTWNTFALGAFYERDATVEPAIVKAWSLTATVSRRFTRQTSLLVSYALERIRRFEVADEREESRRRSVDFTFTKDTRDYYFNPMRGRYMTFETRYSGGVLGGEDHFYSLVGSLRSYTRLRENTVLAYRIRAGYTEAFGDTKERGLPIESRFFTGGGNSVRGYRENSLGPLRDGAEPLGGRVMLLTNIELRFPIPYLSRFNFGGTVFLDGGNVWQSIEEIKLEYFKLRSDADETSVRDYRYGVGFGLRYYTPVGPLRLDIGFPLKKTAEMDYDNWVHISLGQIF